ncbi:comE, comEA protein [Oxalobacteraceae bacterium]
MLKKFFLLVVGVFFITASAWAAVEINSADQAALDGIAGIGPATSKAILEERNKHGNFRDWADLEQRVRGIGEKNSVKLSAAGLVVNGQPRNPGASPAKMPAKKPAEPMKPGDAKN